MTFFKEEYGFSRTSPLLLSFFQNFQINLQSFSRFLWLIFESNATKTWPQVSSVPRKESIVNSVPTFEVIYVTCVPTFEATHVNCVLHISPSSCIIIFEIIPILLRVQNALAQPREKRIYSKLWWFNVTAIISRGRNLMKLFHENSCLVCKMPKNKWNIISFYDYLTRAH